MTTADSEGAGTRDCPDRAAGAAGYVGFADSSLDAAARRSLRGVAELSLVALRAIDRNLAEVCEPK